MKKIFVYLLLAVALFSGGCQKSAETVNVAEEKESDVAMIINGEEISRREWNFYVRMNQLQWERDYLESYGDDMWSMEVSEDGMTLAESLKQQVQDMIIETHIFCQHAEEYEVTLPEDDQAQLKERAADFMEAYHENLLRFAEADKSFVYEKLCENLLAERVAEASVAEYEPDLSEADYHREGICYVLISTTGLRDSEGNLEPFSEEEVEWRNQFAQELYEKAVASGDLQSSAEEEGLTAILSSMGRTNAGDGQEPRMLDAARALPVGGISEPVWTEEGWFLVQHTSDYDESGTEYWKSYLTEQEKAARSQELYEEWKSVSDIVLNKKILDTVTVKDVLKELL